jgi:hypothetical protein
MILIRTYEPKDYEMIAQWHAGHKLHHRSAAPFIPKEAVPPIGQVAYREKDGEREDIAAMFLYLAQAVPVCFVEHATTKPGLAVRTSIQALSSLLLCLKEAARNMGCLMMVSHTIPAIARYMKRAGWHESAKGLVSMVTLTNESV